MANIIACNVVMFIFGVMTLLTGLRAGTWDSDSKPFKITGLVLGLMSIAGVIVCTVFWTDVLVNGEENARLGQQRMDEAKGQLMDLYQRLPQIQGFTTLSMTVGVFDSIPDSWSCYEVRANSIIGVTSTVTDALNVYSGALRTSGWSEPSQQDDTFRVFFSPSTNVALNITGIAPGYLERDPTFLEWKRSNRNILFLVLNEHHC